MVWGLGFRVWGFGVLGFGVLGCVDRLSEGLPAACCRDVLPGGASGVLGCRV